MSLIFKLIGLNDGNTLLHLNIEDQNINLSHLQQILLSLNIKHDDIKQIKFITDSEQIRNNEKNIMINKNETKIIFIFTADLELRNKLVEIFNKNKNIKINITKESATEIYMPVSTTDNIKSSNLMTSNIIENINKTTLVLFNDPDFRNLLDIYLRKPELFGILAQYIQYEEIVISSENNKSYNDLNEEEKIYYNNLADKIKELNINVPNEQIINKLIKYSGHLNLTLHDILYDLFKNNNN